MHKAVARVTVIFLMTISIEWFISNAAELEQQSRGRCSLLPVRRFVKHQIHFETWTGRRGATLTPCEDQLRYCKQWLCHARGDATTALDINGENDLAKRKCHCVVIGCREWRWHDVVQQQSAQRARRELMRWPRASGVSEAQSFCLPDLDLTAKVDGRACVCARERHCAKRAAVGSKELDRACSVPLYAKG
jgi:hypothetical protein